VTAAEVPLDGQPGVPTDLPRLDVVTVLLVHVGDRTFSTTGEIFASFPDLEPET